jgi:hypothetical protein
MKNRVAEFDNAYQNQQWVVNAQGRVATRGVF